MATFRQEVANWTWASSSIQRFTMKNRMKAKKPETRVIGQCFAMVDQCAGAQAWFDMAHWRGRACIAITSSVTM